MLMKSSVSSMYSFNWKKRKKMILSHFILLGKIRSEKIKQNKCYTYRCQLVQGAINDNKICFQQHLKLLYTFRRTFWAPHALMSAPCNAQAFLKLPGFRGWRNRRNRSRNRCTIGWSVSHHRLITIEWCLHPLFLLSKIHFSHISIIIHELLYFIPNLIDITQKREQREKKKKKRWLSFGCIQ